MNEHEVYPRRGDGTGRSEFHHWFGRLLSESGLSRRQLAEKLDRGKSPVSRHFAGPEIPPLQFVQEVAAALEADEISWTYYWRAMTRLDAQGVVSDVDLAPPWWRQVESSTHSGDAHDLREDGLFLLGEWSRGRRLEGAEVVTNLVTRPRQKGVPPKALEDAVAKRVDDTGDLAYLVGFSADCCTSSEATQKLVTGKHASAYLVGFKIDHRESAETKKCRMRFADSKYAEVRAIEALRTESPRAFDAADAALEANANDYLAHAVPSSLAVNIVLVSGRQTVLCARRSAAVDNAVGQWTVGVFETLKLSDAESGGNVLWNLAARGAREELKLSDGDIDELSITWLGIYQPLLRGHAVAVLRTHLDEGAILERAGQAESSYEHDGYYWLPLTQQTQREFSLAPAAPDAGHTVGAGFDAFGRHWLGQSRLALDEAMRWTPRAMPSRSNRSSAKEPGAQ